MCKVTIGVTGGFACGKSTFAKFIAELCECEYHSADEIVTNIYEKYGISKQILKETVCHNPKFLEKLELWIKPKFLTKLHEIISSNTKRFIVFEIPLLFELNFEVFFDFIICVVCSNKNLTKKMIDSKNFSKKLLDWVLNRQYSIDKKIKMANFVIDNNSSKEKLFEQSKLLVQQLLMLKI